MRVLTRHDAFHLIGAWLVLLVALAIRLLLAGHFLLSPDEANYWQWSRHLAPGYHDHPPLIAWSIRLATSLLGNSEFAVRLPTVLGVTIASAYLVLLARRCFSATCALHVAILSQGILLINGSALIATPDGLLLACWAGACHHGLVAVQEQRRSSWLATGFWVGLGLLAKYTMVLFLPSFFLCLLSNSAWRPSLLRAAPWQALLLSLLLFCPVLIWNAANDWVTFRHVLYQGGVGEGGGLSWKYLPDFLGAQAALMSPLVFFLVAWSVVTGWRNGAGRGEFHAPYTAMQPSGSYPNQERGGQGAAERQSLPYGDERHGKDDVGVASNATWNRRYLVWLSLPTLLVFVAMALQSRVYGNWPAPAYLTALVLLASLHGPSAGHGPGRRKLWRWTVGMAYGLSLPLMIQLISPWLPLPARYDRIARETLGWDELARTVHERSQTMSRPGETFFFGLRYQFASELAFYLPDRPETVSINRWTRPNVYDFWQNDEELLGRDAIGVFEGADMAERLATLFERVDPAEKIVLRRRSFWFGQEEYAAYYLLRGYGFKGGVRWQPREPGDIRSGTPAGAGNPLDASGFSLRRALAGEYF